MFLIDLIEAFFFNKPPTVFMLIFYILGLVLNYPFPYLSLSYFPLLISSDYSLLTFFDTDKLFLTDDDDNDR